MQKIRTGLLVTMYLLLLVHQYIEVPGFLYLFIGAGVVALLVSWKENIDFNKRLDAVPYEFRIQKAEESSKKKDAIGFAVGALFLVAIFYIEIPWEQRASADDVFPFLIIFLVLGYTTLLKPQYDYYHFGEAFITGPGPGLETIRWSDIRTVETKKDKDIFYLNLKKGSPLLFDLKNYYSDRKWEEVMGYFEERGVIKVAS